MECNVLKSGTYNLHCCWSHKFTIKAMYAKLNTFVQLTVTCNSANTNRMHYCLLTAKWLYHVTLYEHYLSC